MIDPTSYQQGYSDAKVGKPSAFPVAPTPSPTLKPAVTPPPPIISVGPQSLDDWIDKANMGDTGMIARLAALPGGPNVVYQLNTTASIKNPLIKAIRAIGGATLIPAPPGNDPQNPSPTFDLTMPGVTIDGFTTTARYGIFFKTFADSCTLQNCRLGPGAGAVRTSGFGPAHHNNGGTNCIVRDVVMTAETDASVVYADRDGFQLVNFVSLGSTGENGVRFDSPTAGELPTITVTGGIFSTMNDFGKSTMTFRTAKATVTGAKFTGRKPAVGIGQTYLPGDPHLPNPISLLVPGYYADVTFDLCEWDGMDVDNNKAVPYISANEGTIALIRTCNFKGIGPWKHRLPVSTRVTQPPFPAEIARTTLIDCTGNAPSIGAPGGKPGSLLPQIHPGANESGSRWF